MTHLGSIILGAEHMQVDAHLMDGDKVVVKIDTAREGLRSHNLVVVVDGETVFVTPDVDESLPQHVPDDPDGMVLQ